MRFEQLSFHLTVDDLNKLLASRFKSAQITVAAPAAPAAPEAAATATKTAPAAPEAVATATKTAPAAPEAVATATAPVGGRAGTIYIRHNFQLGPWPIPIGLTVRVKVAALRPNLVALALACPQLPTIVTQGLLQILMKSRPLQGLEARDSYLLIKVDALAAAFGSRLQLHSLSFDENGLKISLLDVHLPDTMLPL